jgi:hypothetical protein
MNLICRFPLRISARTASVRLLEAWYPNRTKLGQSEDRLKSRHLVRCFLMDGFDYRVFLLVRFTIVADAAKELTKHQAIISRVGSGSKLQSFG